ncbi:hypothetical protein [Marinobacter sp. HN1S83]|uniref:hypothetical protein n=1 Tax=Marinobacter sp. HN1S83 TaxID=3382301 RepID=UPI00387B399F
MRFSEQRAILSQNPAETLNEFFDYYVGQNFVTKEYQEGLMEKNIKRQLDQENLGKQYQRRVAIARRLSKKPDTALKARGYN